MAKLTKIPTSQLRTATLEIARNAGHELTSQKSPRGQKIFDLGNGKTVRLRTSNDRCLICSASDPNMHIAKLDIEGTDLVLFGVPTEVRGMSFVEAYLVPTELAAKTVKTAHAHWVESESKTKGQNRTPCLWLDKIPSGQSAPTKELWAQHHLGTLEL